MVSYKRHYWHLPDWFRQYAEDRGLEYHQYSDFHMRVVYPGADPFDPIVAILDAWTTGRYWVKETNYLHDITERGGETGRLPVTKRRAFYNWLDEFFFIVEKREARSGTE